MADAGEDYDPEKEKEELTEQEKLKLELQKLAEEKEKAKDTSDPNKKPVETQTPPEPEPTKVVTGPITMDPNAPALPQPDYTVKPDVKIKMLSPESRPGRTFSPEVERAIDATKHLYPNLKREEVGALIEVESSGVASANINKPTQYKGLLQIGAKDRPNEPSEWTKYGGGASVYDPYANLVGGAKIMERNRQIYIKKYGKEPPLADLYLMHQQGPGFFLNGTMTNIAGNLPPDARKPENMTWIGFRRWWTDRIERAVKARGTAPTMRKVEDSGLPAGFLYPGPFADVGGPPLTTGGGNSTPAEQALTTALMNPRPLTQLAGMERAVTEEQAAARADPNRKNNVIQRVPTSRETRQVQGELPVDPDSVLHTETLPIPGIQTEGERALLDATNPSVMSTINNYMADQGGVQPSVQPPPPVEDQINKPFGELKPTPTFLDKLKSVVASLAPQGTAAGDAQRRDLVKELTNEPPLPETSVSDWIKNIAQADQRATRGLVAGIASQPGQIARAVGGSGATIAGMLGGHDPLTKWGIETSLAAQEGADAWKKAYKVDPNDPTQSTTFKVGENLGPNLARTLLNLGTAAVAEEYLPPAVDYMSKNYPIPNLNPISPAHAGSVFGAPPLVVNTPAGPVVMNDADKSQFAWGGIFMLGFGSSVPLAAKGVRVFRTAKAPGLDDVFDPRREVPGAPGTQAASIPADLGKGAIIDPGKAMQDIANRQFNYENATRVGIDPIAANEVLQAWRVQTNSGAQNLIRTALKNGEMNVPEYRFNVNTPMERLIEFSKASPQFLEYLRLRAIQDEIRANTASNQALPPTSVATPRPVHFDDPNNNGVRFTENNTTFAISRMEHDNPNFNQMYLRYRDNLDATRDVISSHPMYNVENYAALIDHSVDRPTLPIFSAHASRQKLFDQFLIGKNPLEVAETNMRKAFEKQMKFDAEQRYIKMTYDNVGTKAFTPRDQAYIDSPQGKKAADIGAVLTRRHDGETIHYTADPLLVSMMNSGHVPLSAMESTFAGFKSVFQKTTTGFFAPWFAPTGMIRSMEQGWTTAPGGVRSATGVPVLPAGPLSTVYGLAARVGAQVSRPTARFFSETVANTNLGRILTAGQADLIGRSFEKWYMDSFYRRMEVAGAFSGESVMEGKEVYKALASHRQTYGGNPHLNPIVEYMNNALGNVKRFTWDPVKKGFYEPLNGFLTAVQEAPAYGWAYKAGKTATDTRRPTIKGREISDAELAAHFRNYTGDPATRGYIYQKSGKPLTFMSEGSSVAGGNTFQKWLNMTGRATWGPQAAALTTLAKGAHWGRSVTPWAGVLFQSPSATLAAMRDNPVRANLSFMAAHVLPEMTAYLWNSYYSNQDWPVLDDTGAPVIGADGKPKTIRYDYVNHSVNGRNSHNSLNNVWWANPGRPPSEGIEFRHYQEGAMNRYMTRMFMHQYFGKAYGTMGEDIANGLKGFMATAIIPPLPSPLGVYLGSKGVVATGGWTGSLFKSRYNPYIDLGGGESTTELVFRALAPAIADVTIQAMQAGMEAEEGEVTSSAAKQVGKRILGRTAIIGDAFGVKPDVSGSTTLSEETWTNKKVIDDLAYRFRVWDDKQGQVQTNKGSKAGREHIKPHFDDLPPGPAGDAIPNPGMQQHPPKNPLYNLLMSEIQKSFILDEPKKGGMGFKSMWGRYGIYGQLAARMRTVNEGNSGWWIEEQLDSPERMNWLRERNVNPLDFRAVKDFYTTERNKTIQVILNTIKSTEQRMSKMPEVQKILKGRDFKVYMLDPDDPNLKSDRELEKELQDQ